MLAFGAAATTLGIALKIRDLVGLYLNPPDKAVVLCIDEKSQVQALDRTAPVRPLRLGMPEKQTHEYVRHGTTPLFAALEVATRKVTDAYSPRHRNEEFLAFLNHVAKAYPRRKLHILCDNYATHKHPTLQTWLAKNQRITMRFTPTSGSWRNMVEIFFRHHYPAGHPPRNLQQRQRPHRRHRGLHRRLERTLQTVRVDQARRRHHQDSHQR